MQVTLRACTFAAALIAGLSHAAANAQSISAPSASALPGNSVESLLDYARERNPEYASMRHEADAASARASGAGALPDPKLQIELEDITKMGEQNPTLSPSRVGRTTYRIVQELPWFGKRGLERDIAAFEAEGAGGRARGTWAELSSRIKSGYAQYYYIHQNERLTKEILDLMSQLEKVTQVRYAGGLAAHGQSATLVFGILIMAFAVLCWMSARMIPPTGQAAPTRTAWLVVSGNGSARWRTRPRGRSPAASPAPPR